MFSGCKASGDSLDQGYYRGIYHKPSKKVCDKYPGRAENMLISRSQYVLSSGKDGNVGAMNR